MHPPNPPRRSRRYRGASPRPLPLALLILSALALSSTASADTCTPSFPYDAGWLGADGAYSIPIANGRVLWLFGDTFISARKMRRPRAGSREKSRAGSQMIANSIAISSCPAGKWKIDYRWNTPAHRRDRPRPFFDSRVRSFRYWPLDGVLYRNTLYVALMRVRSTRARGPFAFTLLGIDLAIIANPDADPRNWSITYKALSRSRTVFPGGSIVVREPYAYLLGVIDHDRHRRHALILTRIYLDHLDRPAESLEYLAACHPDRSPRPDRDFAGEPAPGPHPHARLSPFPHGKGLGVRLAYKRALTPKSNSDSGNSDSVASAPPVPVPNRCVHWKPAPFRKTHALFDAVQLTPDAQDEFSVRYHPEISRWVLVDQQPGLFTDRIGYRTAPHLDGPWSAWRSLTIEPEMHRHTPRRRIFCYAAKEHPEFESTPATILATYACNSFSFRKLIRDMSIYHPVVIQLPMH